MSSRQALSIESRFREKTIELLGLSPPFPTKERVILAVSGGSDSMALLHLAYRCGLFYTENLVVAHFDHALRDTSDKDAVFVEKSAINLALPFVKESWKSATGQDSPHPALQASGNLHEKARTARYDFLIRTAQDYRSKWILTGHQSDDQAETVLHRLIRGSGLQGLAAIRPTRQLTVEINRVSPLLSCQRQVLRTWLNHHSFPWREDPSNDNQTYTRSRLRHTVIPALATTLSMPPGTLSHTLSETARRLHDADMALEWALDEQHDHLHIELTDEGISALHAPFHALPNALASRMLVRIHRILTR
ncbi:MAG: tRNA lysidine(34) synthetase TilS, partial [Magnetococcales bacterium]|nr:tRNA lysidine(34) synthetase TilS [Magnetococcales bacterium]